MSIGGRRIGVLGLGHVGLPTAVGFAELGWSVVGTDSDAAKTKMIGAGKAPFYEPGLAELFSKHLASGRFRPIEGVEKAVREADVLFIFFGTPQLYHPSAYFYPV